MRLVKNSVYNGLLLIQVKKSLLVVEEKAKMTIMKIQYF